MRQIFRKAAAKTAITLAAVCALAIAGCSSSSSEPEPTVMTGLAGNAGDISKNFNPLSPTATLTINGMVYEALFHYNAAAANTADANAPQPVLGESMTWDDKGQVLTIKVRPGVKWSDGSAMTAKDVAFTFNYVAANTDINPSGFKGKTTAVDDTTVKVDFGAPSSYTLAPTIVGNTSIVPEALWKDVTEPSKYQNETPVGTGPYTMGDFSPQSFKLHKNPNYWDAGKPVIDEVRWVAYGSADSATTAFLNGDLDWMSAYIPGLEMLVEHEEDLSFVNNHVLTAVLGACNSTKLGCKGPQTDPAIRHAIYYALDRTNLNAAAFDNTAAQPSYTMMVPGRDDSWFAPEPDALAPMAADTAKAEQLLQDAGWQKGSDGIYAKDGERASLTIQVVSGYVDYIASLQSMTEQAKAVGIELEVRQISWNEWNNNQNTGTFQLSMDSMGLGVTPNPYYVYQYRFDSAQTAEVGTAANGNWGRYDNPTVDAAIKAAGATDDTEVQKVEFQKIQTELAKDMPYIPVVIQGTLTEFNNARINGWPTPDKSYAFPAVWKAYDNGVVVKALTPVG